jgi:hypothetical protein
MALSAIEKRWPAGFWDAGGLPRGRAWDLRRTAYVVTFACLITTSLIEMVLWFRRPVEAFLLPRLVPFLAGNEAQNLLLLLPALLNGWILDRYLSQRAPGPQPVARWLRLARAALLSVPVFGLWAIPAWQRIQSRNPDWAFRPAPPPRLDLRSPLQGSSFLQRTGAHFGRWYRRRASSLGAFLLWLLGCQLLPLNALLSIAMPKESLSPGRILVLVVLGVFCHIVVYLGVTLYLAERRPRNLSTPAAGWRHRFGPLLLLLPMPFPVLSFLIWLPLTEEAAEEKTLTFAAWSSRSRRPVAAGRSRRHNPGERFGFALLGLGISSASGNVGRREERLRSLFRQKSALLVLEGVALAVVFVLFGRRLPFAMDSGTDRLYFVLLLAASGFLWELGSLVRRAVHWFLRRPLPSYQPVGYFAAVTWLALLVGILLGNSLAMGNGREVALLLQVIGWISFSAAILLLPVGVVFGLPGRHVRVAAFWMPLFLLLILTGLLPTTDGLLTFLKAGAFAAPLAGLLIGWWALPALLHPFTFCDSKAPDLPGLVRLRLAFLAGTALLPLGGIAVPLWITLRRRLPELYEKYRSGSSRRPQE